jgi:hypothetical protein
MSWQWQTNCGVWRCYDDVSQSVLFAAIHSHAKKTQLKIAGRKMKVHLTKMYQKNINTNRRRCVRCIPGPHAHNSSCSPLVYRRKTEIRSTRVAPPTAPTGYISNRPGTVTRPLQGFPQHTYPPRPVQNTLQEFVIYPATANTRTLVSRPEELEVGRDQFKANRTVVAEKLSAGNKVDRNEEELNARLYNTTQCNSSTSTCTQQFEIISF